MYEYELEALPEFEEEYEGEWEDELEEEFEDEEFFRTLAGVARRAVQSPTLRRIGLAAGRAASAVCEADQVALTPPSAC